MIKFKDENNYKIFIMLCAADICEQNFFIIYMNKSKFITMNVLSSETVSCFRSPEKIYQSSESYSSNTECLLFINVLLNSDLNLAFSFYAADVS